MEREFEHVPLGEEFEAVAGRYSITREDSLNYEGREVLYLVGVGSFDASCCGEGGCAYAVVPGFIIRKDAGKTELGRSVSLVEPIEDPGTRKAVEAAIRKKEFVQQVNFL